MSVVMFFMPTGQQAQHRGRPSTTLGHRARQGRSRPWALCPPSVYWQPNKSARALEATAMLRDADLGHDAQAMCRLASSVPASSDFEVNHTCSLLPKLAGCGPAFRERASEMQQLMDIGFDAPQASSGHRVRLAQPDLTWVKSENQGMLRSRRLKLWSLPQQTVHPSRHG